MNESLKNWDGGGWVRVDFARQLEIQRDEALKEAEYYRERYDQLKDEREMSDRPKWYNGREIPNIKEESK